MNAPSASCNRQTIEQFLADQLTDEEQTTFENHLECCPSCRQCLDELAAEGSWWEETRGYLSSASPLLPEDSTLEDSAPGPEAQDNGPALFGLHGYLAPTDDPRMLGRLGGYEIAGVIGVGGMGIVLKGFDAPLNRYVAVKVLAPHLALSGAARQRFAREAKAAATVVHDNVMAIHAVAEANALPYFVMPYVPGPSLEKRLRETGALALVEILRIGMQIASGLAAAHAQGLVHRDIKPANILLEEGIERVRITDFGLARAVDDASLTRTGVIAGTPQYMSPEQAAGEAVDHRSDLFSLGSVLYALCTGRPPFRADTTLAMLRRVEEDRARPIRETNPEIPDWLASIIQRLHAKRPDDRFQSAAEVASLLEGFLAHVQQPATTAAPLLPKAVDEGCPNSAEAAMKSEAVRGFVHRSWMAVSMLLVASMVGVLALFAVGRLAFRGPSEDLKPRVTFGEGFLREEEKGGKTWRWTGDYLPKEDAPLPLEGIVNLMSTDQEMTLTITGTVPLYALPGPPTMKIIFNGETLEEFVPTDRTLKKVYLVPVSKQSKSGTYSELRISTNRVFIPSEFYKDSTDPYRHGFQLTKLTWSEKKTDERGADAPEWQPRVEFGAGFFALERHGDQTWRWVGDGLPKEGPVPIEGVVKVRNTRKDMFLKIGGYVPVHGIPEAPTIKILFNGEQLDQFIMVRHSFEKSFKVPAALQSKDETSELRFSTSNFLIPTEISKTSKDGRRLGFKITRLTWSEKEDDASEVALPDAPKPAPKGKPADQVDVKAQETGSKLGLAVALLVALGVSLTLVLALAAWLYIRNRRRLDAPNGANDKDVKDLSQVALVTFSCSGCGKRLKTKTGTAGKKVKCPHCGQAVPVPAPSESPDA